MALLCLLACGCDAGQDLKSTAGPRGCEAREELRNGPPRVSNRSRGSHRWGVQAGVDTVGAPSAPSG